MLNFVYCSSEPSIPIVYKVPTRNFYLEHLSILIAFEM